MPAVPSTHSWILHALYYKNSSRYSTTSMQTECIFWQVWLSPNLTKKRREWSHSYLYTMASFRIFYPENSIHEYFTYIFVLRRALDVAVIHFYKFLEVEFGFTVNFDELLASTNVAKQNIAHINI